MNLIIKLLIFFQIVCLLQPIYGTLCKSNDLNCIYQKEYLKSKITGPDINSAKASFWNNLFQSKFFNLVYLFNE